MITSRKTSPQDAAQIAAWVAADPDHAGRVSANFFLPSENPSDTKAFFYTIEDALGPVFYVRGENVLRLHVQFAPNQKRRTPPALDEFISSISEGAKKLGYKQIIYDSVFQPLIQFLERRGFKPSPQEQVKFL